MTELNRIKILNLLRKIVWYLDYIVYLILNPYKWKPFPKEIKNILIVELKLVGDIIVTTPAIRALKERYPQVNIYVMVPPSMKEILLENKNVKGIITYEKEFIKKNLQTVIADIENYHFDLAIMLHPGSYMTSKMLAKAKIPFRIGATKVGIFEGKGLFLHRKTKPTWRLKHKIDDNLDVLKTINIYTTNKRLELFTTKEAEYNINKIFLKNRILNKDKIVCIHTKPNVKNHEWYQERFAEVADYIIERYQGKIIFTGSKNDTPYVKSIMTQMKNKTAAFDLSGTTLQEFFSLIKRADLVISVDTAAMHIAAAFDKPVIALFGAGTHPKIWHPYTSKYIVIYKDEVCTSCGLSNCILKGSRFMECMNTISATDVKRAINQLGVLS